MVLQRAPAQAAVFGFGAPAGAPCDAHLNGHHAGSGSAGADGNWRIGARSIRARRGCCHPSPLRQHPADATRPGACRPRRGGREHPRGEPDGDLRRREPAGSDGDGRRLRGRLRHLRPVQHGRCFRRVLCFYSVLLRMDPAAPNRSEPQQQQQQQQPFSLVMCVVCQRSAGCSRGSRAFCCPAGAAGGAHLQLLERNHQRHWLLRPADHTVTPAPAARPPPTRCSYCSGNNTDSDCESR